jgi:cysteine desulfurase / selenocysteine lyase
MTNSTIASAKSKVSEISHFDIDAIRENFPILNTKVYNKPLIYFDNAATSQKPREVIDRITRYYEQENANVHRGIYYLSELASNAYEGARDSIQKHINAAKREEVIFVRGATEGINLVAASWGRKNLKPGDEVLISAMEHHANIVPWQQVCNEKGSVLKVIPVTDTGELDLNAYKTLITEKTRLVAIVYVSNSIGTINPVKEVISIAHNYDIPVLIDGCQAAPHLDIDVQELDCDFFTFSGHKVFGPTGIGILYGKEKFLDQMPPYQTGGDMIRQVTFEQTTFQDPPYRFEAGTPHIEGAVGLAAAFDYINSIGRDKIRQYEQMLMEHGKKRLLEIEGLRIIGNAPDKIPVFSFVVEGAHPLDIGTLLDFEGIAVRTGNHCTQPLLNRFGVTATCRASLAFYNTVEEIDYFTEALEKVIKKLKEK